MHRISVNATECWTKGYEKVQKGGLLLNSISKDGKPNSMTIGWWIFGWNYMGKPMSAVAVRPARYTFTLLDEVEEYVVAIPNPGMEEAVSYCGRASGRDVAKFRETNLTIVESAHVKPPSIKDGFANVECRIYYKQRPPHSILSPQFRELPLKEQHTIYFAEVLGIYRYVESEK